MAVGFHCDGNWMYSGSEDGTVRIWDLRGQSSADTAPGAIMQTDDMVHWV